jgi:hypothetical protein
MAIGISSVVSVKLPPAVNAQSGKGPVFGISESAATPFTITWEDGSRVASIPDTSLDEILIADAAVSDAQLGRLCRITDPAAGNWGQGIAVSCYKRVGAATVAYTLLRNQAGFFIEVPSANVEVV